MRDELQQLLDRYQAGSAELQRPDRLSVTQIVEMPQLFQPRHGIDAYHASELSKVVDRTKDLDPVTLIVVGGEYILIDGHHRMEAYRRSDNCPEDVPVQFFEGGPVEALVQVGAENGKLRLNLTPKERQDFAWRLVVGGLHTRPQVMAASGISRAQVTVMVKVKKSLGEDADNYDEWFKARRAANGKDQREFTDEEVNLWMEQRAERIAAHMAKHLGIGLVNDTEVAAMAISRYFGRRLEDLYRQLRTHLPKDLEDDLEEDEF